MFTYKKRPLIRCMENTSIQRSKIFTFSAKPTLSPLESSLLEKSNSHTGKGGKDFQFMVLISIGNKSIKMWVLSLSLSSFQPILLMFTDNFNWCSLDVDICWVMVVG